MAHVNSPEAEKLLDLEVRVLDKGFVRLVDYMGGDARIVQAARVSYGAGTKTVREDSALIDYLLRNDHTSPFEQVVLTFHIKAPIFVARQWVRHRTARLNEISGRYSELADEFYLPAPTDIRPQSKTNRQGRATEALAADVTGEVVRSLNEGQRLSYSAYTGYLQNNVARELARINLPVSLYTQFYWQIDLHNLFHFLKLRLDSHAQLEIRAFGIELANCARAVAPLAYDSFERHVLRGARLSAEELAIVVHNLESSDSPELQRLLQRLKPIHGPD
jgi:thymidylate synthase (FAD)